MLYLAGVGLAFFLSLLLVTKRNKSTADRILACWLLLNTAHLLLFYFQITRQYPQFLGLNMPMPLAQGPFLYLYTRALTNHNVSPRAMILHFLPAFTLLLWMIPFILLSSAEKQLVYDNRGAGFEVFNAVKYWTIIASGITYVALTYLLLRKHRRSIANEFSNTDKINLAWLQYLLYGIGAIWLCVLFLNETAVYTAAVLFVAFIGYFGIRQVGIFHSAESKPSEPEDSEKRKYQKSGLTAEVSERLHYALADLMNRDKVFRESELSLNDLASRLHAPANYLSQVINEREGKTFYDYINTLRIEEFKRLAATPDSRKYTLLGLAQECGFNSKSSFNRYFKKVTGTSPSQFVPNPQD